MLGSPAFQFSYVIGLPVDIQKNLEEYNYGNRVRLGHNLAVKRVLLIETKKSTCSLLLGQCRWSRSAHGPFLEGNKLRIQKKNDMTLSKTRSEFGFVQSDINQIEKYCNKYKMSKSRYLLININNDH